MKISVSVPDELWHQAARLAPATGASELVQRALRFYVQTRRPRADIANEGVLANRLEEAVAEVSVDAQREFEKGYSAGLEGARYFGYQGLAYLAARSFSASDLNWAISGPALSDEAAANEWLESIGHELEDDEFGGNPAYVAGLERALRDVWVETQRSWAPSGESGAPSAGDVSE